MQVTIHKEGAVTVVRPAGPLTAGELEELERRLERLSRDWTGRIVINLGDVPFIDSAGLELLLNYQRLFQGRGIKLKLTHLTDITQTIFEVTRLSRCFEMYPDTGQAVRSFL